MGRTDVRAARRQYRVNEALAEGGSDQSIGERKAPLLNSIMPHDRLQRQRHPLGTALTLLVVASLFATAISLTLPAGSAWAQTTPLSTASVTPATAIFYADVNLNSSSDQWSRANELLARIGQGNVLQSAMNSSNMSASEKALADAVLGGEVAIVLEKFPATGNLSTSSITSDITNPSKLASGVTPQGYALVLAPSDLNKSYTAIQDSLAKQASDAGTTVEKTTYNGVEIDSVAPSAKSSSSSSSMSMASSGESVAKVKDFIVFGSLPEDLHGIIDTASGKTPALADDAHFKALQGELNKDFLAYGYVNGPDFLKSMAAADPSAAAQLGPESNQTFESYSAFVIWADSPGLRIDTMSAPAAGATLPQMKSIDDSMAKKVSADSLVYASSTELGQNPGLQALALAFAQAMLGTTGATPAAMATPAGMLSQADANAVFEESAAMLGFNLKTDFLDQLVGNYAFALTVQNVFSGTPVINGVLVSDTKDEATIANTATRISSLLTSTLGSSATVSSKTVGSSKVTEIDLSASGVPLKIDLGVVNKQFVIGIGQGLDEYVNGPSKALADDPNYQAVIGALPKDHTAVAFLNVPQLLPLIQGYLQTSTSVSGTFVGATPGAMATPAMEASPAMTTAQLAPLKGIGMVSFNKGDMVGSSTIIYIAPK